MTTAAGTNNDQRETFEFRYRWDGAEHRRFIAALIRAEESRRLPKVALLYGTISLIFLVINFVIYGPSNWITWLVPIVVFLVALGSRAIWLLFFPNIAARAYRRQHSACIPEDQIRRITVEGVEASCVVTNTTVRWAGISRAIETPEFFLFRTSPGCAVQVPKRAVGEANLPELRQRIVRELGARAVLLR